MLTKGWQKRVKISNEPFGHLLALFHRVTELKDLDLDLALALVFEDLGVRSSGDRRLVLALAARKT